MELAEYKNRFGPLTIFEVRPVEPDQLTAGDFLLPHGGLELQACYEIRTTSERSGRVIEAVTATSRDGLTASVVALGQHLNGRIGDYPLSAGLTIGDAVCQHWRALEFR